ncbi:hypothetical protein NC652_037185 [Populus alba x Populus x berolinensis]|nr:hypothetical protein NC652_036802 [Populus alba x Populus x berolinensis]KAJ6871748.1 hypothetical protein NC652_037185 [Populus alba x Populus x berolinensis]
MPSLSSKNSAMKTESLCNSYYV